MSAIKDYNVYQLDEFLITVGKAVSIFSGMLLLIGVWIVNQYFLIFMLCGGVACLACGVYIRLIENRVNAIARSLDRVNDIRLEDFATATGFSTDQIVSGIQTINRRGIGFYAVDEKSGRISDMRLTKTVAFSDVCTQCAKKIVEHYTLQSDSVPQCPYCGSPLDMSKWSELKNNTLNMFVQDERASDSAAGEANGSFSRFSQKKTPPFNIGVLVLLLIAFWPLGVLYVLVNHAKSQGLSRFTS
jgi:DNA-directed RNA polymerase subunit RPC12/RpoP